MTEQYPRNLNYYDDVIDLRELVITVLKYKWTILAGIMLSALVAFLVSSFLLSPHYQASAYVTLTEPIVQTNLDASIQVSPVMPDTGALAELAESDAIIREIKERLGLSENEPIEMDAALQGKTQLRLQITARDPELAAQIANAWAESMIQRLNNLYGTGEGIKQVLEIEVENAKDNWEKTQIALEEYLPQSRVEILEVRLSNASGKLIAYLNHKNQLELLISDAAALSAQLDQRNAGDPLSIGSALSIIALQQRASGEISGTQFQFLGEDLLGQGFVVVDGNVIIEDLIIALENQNVEIETVLPALESEISKLSVELESERFMVEMLTQERDLSRTAFTALANQLEETKIIQAQEEKSAQISAIAVSPLEKSGPNTIVNIALAGMLGLMLSVGWILVNEWWNKEEKPK